VPYWHGVASGHAARVTILNTSNGGRAGSTIANAMYFRVTDENGLPVVDARPNVLPVSGGGTVSGLFQVTGAPYTFDTYVRLGTRPGANVFRIQVGDLTKDVTINGQ
jgi:hypothetical protein